jgi:hypothetical protein
MQRTTGLLATAVAAEQEAAAASERRAERKAARSERRDPFSLQGVELMRAVECAVRRNRAARQMPDTEQEALAQMVAERVIVRTGERRGNARAVLAAIGRAERHPLTYAREESQRVERSGAGRELLDRIVTSLVAQSRDWRDTLDRYRTRKQAQADTGPMIDTSTDALGVDFLSRAALADTDPELAPLPEDSRALAEAVAAAVAVPADDDSPGLTDAETRRVAVALLVDLGGVALSAVAADQGRTLNALALDRSRGAAILRDRYPDPLALVRLVRDCAEREALTDPATGDRPTLTLAERVALDGCDRAALAYARVGRAGDPVTTARYARQWDGPLVRVRQGTRAHHDACYLRRLHRATARDRAALAG